jgi:hypothetical protein
MKVKGKMDLNEFLKENHHLLTAMGVFGGLTALFTRIDNADSLSFISFLIFLFLGAEFIRNILKSQERSIILDVFCGYIILLIIGIALYLFRDYTSYTLSTLFGIIILIVVSSILEIIFYFMRKKEKIQLFLNKHKKINVILLVFMRVVLVSVIALATIIIFLTVTTILFY